MVDTCFAAIARAYPRVAAGTDYTYLLDDSELSGGDLARVRVDRETVQRAATLSPMTLSVITRCWYAALACVITVPIVGTLVLIARANKSVGNFFSYFTVQSNLLTLALAVLLVIDPKRVSDAFQILRIAALTGITVTGLVYGGLIAPYVHPKGIERVYDSLFHYVSPAMAVVGFFVLLPRTRLRARHLWFIAWPLCWLGYTLIRAAVSQPDYAREDGTFARYPYGFLDVDLHGWGTVIGFIVAITVLLLAVASIYSWLSRKLAPADRDQQRLDVA